ncbi:MAG TPA: FliH/SctL family protein, partial [Sphingomonadaceae bacterium]|nr:FliH/SctL family protein [Sphingomonadaceae bacterium]
RRLDLLAASLEKLQPTRERLLADCEILALQLSRTALKRVFGEESLQADLLRATLTYHLSALQKDMVRQVRVSARDFRSIDDLAALGECFPGLTLIADETLEPGDCMVDLRLGALDIGLAGQWQRLSAFFDQLASSEERAAP